MCQNTLFTNICIYLCFYAYFKDAGTYQTIGGKEDGEVVYAIINKHDSTSKGKGGIIQ